MRGAEAARGLLLVVGVVVAHTDADGLTAGALVLRARDETAVGAVLLPRGVTPFGPEPPLPPRPAAVGRPSGSAALNLG